MNKKIQQFNATITVGAHQCPQTFLLNILNFIADFSSELKNDFAHQQGGSSADNLYHVNSADRPDTMDDSDHADFADHTGKADHADNFVYLWC